MADSPLMIAKSFVLKQRPDAQVARSSRSLGGGYTVYNFSETLQLNGEWAATQTEAWQQAASYLRALKQFSVSPEARFQTRVDMPFEADASPLTPVLRANNARFCRTKRDETEFRAWVAEREIGASEAA